MGNITLPDKSVEYLSDRRARAFIHVRLQPAPKMSLEGDLVAAKRPEVSFGARYAFTSHQATSAVFSSTVRTAAPFTLQPTSIAGLAPDDAPSAIGSRTTALVGKWESEWSNRIFTSLELQHQKHQQLLVPAVNAALSFVHSDRLRPAYLFAGDGSMTRLTLTSNLLLADNLALDVAAAKSWSEHEYLSASNYAKAELVWSIWRGFRGSLASTYIGRRKDEYFEAVASESDVHNILGRLGGWMAASNGVHPIAGSKSAIHVYNIFGRAIDVYNFYPRFGRTAVATVSARF